jgi:SAM-dependent methyltransferase
VGDQDDSNGWKARARAFGPVAETYARVRPGYPLEAITWLLPEGARRVLDVGAGTGALSRSLVSVGLEVVAVEPDPEMRRVLNEQLPGIDVRAGRAEELPLDTADVDAVLGGQMWHWVDTQRAGAEVARVMRPGGTLGLLWNLRDERVSWMAALGALVHGEDRTGALTGRKILPGGSPFDGGAVRQFPWSQELTPSDVVDLMATRSQVQVLDEKDRRAVLDQVAELVRTHPDLAGKPVLEVPYVTSCFRAVRRADVDAGADLTVR